MTILIFLFVLFILVLVHEFGHFIVAKRTGMRVDEFGIGFPPRLFSIKRGETVYSFNLFPIGGFVKIFGEDAIDAQRSLVDRHRSFVARSRWSQVAVLIAGVSMNVLFAWMLIVIALSFGVQTIVSESTAGASAQLVATQVLNDSPAYAAGLRNGVVITGAYTADENLEERTPSAFSAFIQTHPSEPITLNYKKGTTEFTADLNPERGVISEDSDRAAIGVALALVDVVARPFPTALWEGTLTTIRSLRDITVGISSLLYDAIRFDADFSQVAGPVGIVGLVGEASSFGITSLLMFTAFISLNLAIINLLPFPALDGGRLLFVLIEAVKGSPIKPQFVHALNTFGFILLILLMIAVTFNDISRII